MLEMCIKAGISVEELLCMVILMIESYYDLKYQRIPVRLLCLSGLAAVVYSAILQREVYVSCIMGACVGAFLLLLGKITKEGIGYGDGITFMLSGMLLGFRKNVLLLCVSLLLSAVFSIVLLVVKKGNRKTTFPFIPCVLIADVIVMFCGGWDIE